MRSIQLLDIQSSLPFLVLFLLDVMMPGMNGYEVCEILKSDDSTSGIPIIFITALNDAVNETKGIELGAVDYITKPINPDIVKSRVRNHLKLKKYQDHLEELVEERTLEIKQTQEATIESMAALAEFRDPETGGHIRRTQNYIKVLAQTLRQNPKFQDNLDDQTIYMLYLSAPLHDIGKVGIPDEILLKPGKLTLEEFEIMKMHTVYGRDAIATAEKKIVGKSFLSFANEIAYGHQEKWDGSGYPEGLSSEEIPLSARLMAIADVYDALISKRVYKPAYTHEDAVGMIKNDSGTHFDPEIVDAFLHVTDLFDQIGKKYIDKEIE
ncbi:MAG: response regulator [Candidatus Marinimicrobia bacterium]|nr:response regulator [Candidatus Neomarinimicrobiota bacterium]